MTKKSRSPIWLVFGSALAHLLTAHPIAAQIVPDATLPVNSIVTPPLPPAGGGQGAINITIEGGTKAGSNLFHSFQEFSVPTGTEALFNNSLDIQNIFTRVTGSSTSNIDGLIRANGTANLFLLNPNGIIFGPNARLNIGGSFLASTATSLKFSDGIEFSASNPNAEPLLTINIPVGLQFGANPGPIAVNGLGHNLTIDINTGKINRSSRNAGLQLPDRTLALVGGEITFAGGNLTADSGRIELGSVGKNSLVTLSSPSGEDGLRLSYANIENFQDINLLQTASVDASGSRGGTIQVQGRRLTLTDGSAILANTFGSRSGGNLIVNVSEIVEARGTSFDSNFPSALFADTYSTGKGGNLIINTTSLLLRDGALVRADTFGAGKAGNLTVNASQQVQAIGVSANGVRPSALFARADRDSTGDAGDVIINTANLLLQNGGQVGAGTFAVGKGGNLTVNASQSVVVSGISPDGQFPSALGPRATVGSTGDAGNLTINTGELIVRDSARLGARGLGQGNAGIVTINARFTLLENQGFISTDSQSLNADPNREQATINLRSEILILRQNSRISTNAEGKNAQGGNINIQTNVVVGLEDSDISANSQNFQGGRVRISAQAVFGSQFRLKPSVNSDITATGGNPQLSGIVEINSPNVNANPRLGQLSVNLVDESSLVAFSCYRRGANASQFVVIGRGGLPATPYNALSSRFNTTGIATLPATVQLRSRSENYRVEQSREIVEASGWTIDRAGNVVLTNNLSEITSANPVLASPSCQGL